MTSAHNMINKSIDSIYGTIKLPSSPTDLIRKTLESHGEWSYLEPLILNSLLLDNDRIYDIGAYIGTFGLGLDKICNLKKIISVEPNHSSWKILTENLKNNCRAPFKTINCSVGLEPGKATEFFHSDNNLGARSYKIENTTSEKNHNNNTVNQFTILQLREQYGSYDLLKLDVEGAEYEALRGDAVWIKNNKPIIWTECNEAPSAQKLLQFYLWAELSPIYVTYPAFRKHNYKNAASTPYPIAYEAAILGGGKERLELFSTQNLDEEIICTPINSYESLRKAMWLTPRWGKKEWTALSNAELIALVGRLSLQQDYSTFLNQE